MSDEQRDLEHWVFGQDNGTITLHTDVAGRAARTGHRLTIEIGEWSGQATTRDDEPVAITATIVVGSLRVVSGEGGLTPLTAPEKAVAQSNALKSLHAADHPEITYESSSINATSDGYRAEGTLTINGRSRPHVLDFARSADGTTVTASSVVSHGDFDLKPYSLMMGALKVADEVGVDISIVVA